MRLSIAVSFCALFLCSPPALPQDVFSVPVVDKSGAGAPLEVSGKATLRESARANALEWSWGEKVEVKNTSGKAILFFVATITEVGRRSAPARQRATLGDGPTYQLEDDRFFSNQLIEPGATLVLRDTNPGVPEIACCINPLAQTHEPSAEYRLEFAQFADGSIFGDRSQAQGSLAIRRSIVGGLRRLLGSYEQGGEAGFTDALGSLRSHPIASGLPPDAEEQPPFSTTAICRQILANYDGQGVKAALEKTKEILKIAEAHAAMSALPHS